MRVATFLMFILVTATGVAQDGSTAEGPSSGNETGVSVDEKTYEAATTDQAAENDEGDSDAAGGGDSEALAEAVEAVSGGLKLTFILLMFTNAVICGRWAIETNRNFWGWYLFGLFTGPLAGGCMLHRVAIDKSAETGASSPNGCLAAILGLGIPLAGWVIWLMVLS